MKQLSAMKAVVRLASIVCLVAGLPGLQAQPINPFNQTRTTVFTYGGNGLVQSTTVEPDRAELCVKTTYTYDSYGNRTGVATANCLSTSGLSLFDRREEEAIFSAQLADATVGRLPIPAGTFKTGGRVALAESLADPATHSERRELDPRFGSVTKLVGPNGESLATLWTYDAFGRTTGQQSPNGLRTISRYCLLVGRISNTSSNTPGCPTSVPNEAPADAIRFEHKETQAVSGEKVGPFARAYYDRAGKLIRTVEESFDGPYQPTSSGTLIVQDIEYNPVGSVSVRSQPYFLATGSSTTSGANDVGLTRTDYDALGRVVAVYSTDAKTAYQAGGNQEAIVFGSWGARARAARTTTSYSGLNAVSTDDLGRTSAIERDPFGHIYRVTDSMGAQLLKRVDAFGNLISTRDPAGNVVSIEYDLLGRKLRVTDPDAGDTSFCYDALGQLKAEQTSNMRGAHGPSVCPVQTALGRDAPVIPGWTTYAYDRVGRMTARMRPEYGSSWYFDRDANGVSCGKSVGKLCQTATNHGINKTNNYDSLGRAINSKTTVSGAAGGLLAATAVSYDAFGRVSTKTYPSGLRIRHHYTGSGRLSRITTDTQIHGVGSIAAGAELWREISVNAWGRSELSVNGNGTSTKVAFDTSTGRTAWHQVLSNNSPSVVDQRLYWDSANQLRLRVDAIGYGQSGVEVADGYEYDDLGRLIQYTVSGSGVPNARTVQLQYNALGMLLYKSDVGVYSYGQQGQAMGKPHALRSVQGAYNNAYQYDLNGNLTAATQGKYRSIEYNSFNLPSSGAGLQGPAGAPKYAWAYDENQQRFKEVRTSSSGVRTTWSLHPDNLGGLSFEREEGAAAPAQNRHYVALPSGATFVVVSEGALPSLGNLSEPSGLQSLAAVRLDYWHKDHLGSVIAATNQFAQVTARYSFDPFGKRRNIAGTYDAFGAIVVDWDASAATGIDRGFTGHEHLDDVGVVHMNGRLFDPQTARFMQPDPVIQNASDLQSYDAYAYCFNNPAACTDPSGFTAWTSFRDAAIMAFAMYLDYIGCSGACSASVAAYQGYRQGGWEQAVTSAFFAYIGAQAGMGDAGTQGFLAASAGCVNAEMGGGRCKDGVNNALTNWAAKEVFGNAAGSAVGGCANAERAGGSCREGARDGAFGYLGGATVAYGVYSDAVRQQSVASHEATQAREIERSSTVGGASSSSVDVNDGGGEFVKVGLRGQRYVYSLRGEPLQVQGRILEYNIRLHEPNAVPGTIGPIGAPRYNEAYVAQLRTVFREVITRAASRGVDASWREFRDAVREGRPHPSRQYLNFSQAAELLRTGRIEGWHAHHQRDVARYPEHAANPAYIRPLPAPLHRNLHRYYY